MAVHALFSRFRCGGSWRLAAWCSAVLCLVLLPIGAKAQYVPIPTEGTPIDTVKGIEPTAIAPSLLERPTDSVRAEGAPVDTALLIRQNEATLAAASVKSDQQVSVPVKAFVPNPRKPP